MALLLRAILQIFMAYLIGTKFDLFDELENHYKQDITKQARKFAKKMNAPLIYCSSELSINVKKIFKIIIAEVFSLNMNAKKKKKKKGGGNDDKIGALIELCQV